AAAPPHGAVGAGDSRARERPCWRQSRRERAMNTANLQLEGVLMAMAALCQLMCEKGIAAEEDIEGSLCRAEEMLATDRLRPEQLSQANVEAMLFPIRF